MRSNPRLNTRAKAAPALAIGFVGSWPGSCFFSMIAARAGESVSELNAESTVATAMVAANCR